MWFFPWRVYIYIYIHIYTYIYIYIMHAVVSRSQWPKTFPGHTFSWTSKVGRRKSLGIWFDTNFCWPVWLLNDVISMHTHSICNTFVVIVTCIAACMAMIITSDIFYTRYVWNGSLLKPECYEYMDLDLYGLISTSNHNTEMFVFPSFLWAAFYFEDTHASHIWRSHGPDVSGGLPLAVATLAGRYWGSTRDSHAQRF